VEGFNYRLGLAPTAVEFKDLLDPGRTAEAFNDRRVPVKAVVEFNDLIDPAGPGTGIDRETIIGPVDLAIDQTAPAKVEVANGGDLATGRIDPITGPITIAGKIGATIAGMTFTITGMAVGTITTTGTTTIGGVIISIALITTTSIAGVGARGPE
jgi:hypothetical protein